MGDDPLFRRPELITALDRLAGVKSHQGVVALGAEKKYAELEDVASTAELLELIDRIGLRCYERFVQAMQDAAEKRTAKGGDQ